MKSKTLIALICLSIPLEGAGSSLVNAGTIEALREGDGAVRCTADATVTVNGGTVLSIACAGGTAVQNEDRQEAVQYALLQCGRQAAAARAARHPVTHRTSGRGARKCAQAARRIRRRSTIASISAAPAPIF